MNSPEKKNTSRPPEGVKRARPKSPGDSGTDSRQVAADTSRYEVLAREHGADLSEEGFNEALRKVGAQKDRGSAAKPQPLTGIPKGPAKGDLSPADEMAPDTAKRVGLERQNRKPAR